MTGPAVWERGRHRPIGSEALSGSFMLVVTSDLLITRRRYRRSAASWLPAGPAQLSEMMLLVILVGTAFGALAAMAKTM